MNISFKPMTTSDLHLWEKWVLVPHVKNTWFLEGYQPPDYINQKIKGNGDTYPFIILSDDNPIGYIQCCDLFAYNKLCDNKKGLFINEQPGTFCMDLFIADTNYLDKGYGRETVIKFCKFVFKTFFARCMLVDPDLNNKRAIRCYEKAGFTKTEVKNDGVTNYQVMQIRKDTNTQQKKLDQFLKPIIKWAYEQPGIASVGLVGSYANDTAHGGSDIDLIFLCNDQQLYLKNNHWITQFGIPIKEQIEKYGKVTSLRIWYQNSFEIEFSFASKDWADIPVDPGTKQVIENGMCLLVDKKGILKNLLSEAYVSSEPITIRNAQIQDVPRMVALSQLKRSAYEIVEPVFWKMADDAEQQQLNHFNTLVNDENHISLVAKHDEKIVGFIIGKVIPAPEVYNPDGLTCTIDDFCVELNWNQIGKKLINSLQVRAKSKGAVQIIVACGDHDKVKKAFLKEQGCHIVTNWFHKEIR